MTSGYPHFSPETCGSYLEVNKSLCFLRVIKGESSVLPAPLLTLPPTTLLTLRPPGIQGPDCY